MSLKLGQSFYGHPVYTEISHKGKDNEVCHIMPLYLTA